MITHTMPLFPLEVVLLPHGRLLLQIFEPRYLDLVSECLKNDTGFGIVWLSQGREVILNQSDSSIAGEEISSLGTYASIVDWDSLPNGLLGITIEGKKKFKVLSIQQKTNLQYIADINWIEEEHVVPLFDEIQELRGLLNQLLEHPHIARLNINKNINDVSHMTFLLTQLLPIDEQIKFKLLSMSDPFTRLEYLMDLLAKLSQ